MSWIDVMDKAYSASCRGQAINENYEVLKGVTISAAGKKPLATSGTDEAVVSTYAADRKDRGGIIVFSYNVNAEAVSTNKLVNWLKQKMMTLDNKLNYDKKLQLIAKKNNLGGLGWTIGRYMQGRWMDKDTGMVFNENSMSFEIIGIGTKKLISIAEDVCREFKQQAVLVKDYSTNEIMFVNKD